jgi:hypothetical protein
LTFISTPVQDRAAAQSALRWMLLSSIDFSKIHYVVWWHCSQCVIHETPPQPWFSIDVTNTGYELVNCWHVCRKQCSYLCSIFKIQLCVLLTCHSLHEYHLPM